MDALTLINLMFPEHDRTSCNDENVSNCFTLKEDGTHGLISRCSRCSALQIAKTGKVPTDGKFFITFLEN